MRSLLRKGSHRECKLNAAARGREYRLPNSASRCTPARLGSQEPDEIRQAGKWRRELLDPEYWVPVGAKRVEQRASIIRNAVVVRFPSQSALRTPHFALGAQP